MTTTNNSVLAQKMGTSDLKKTVGQLGSFQQIMVAFVNYLTSVGSPPQIPAHNDVPASVTNAANKALTQLTQDFQSAQSTASGLQSQINGITDTVNAANAFARHGSITMNSILNSIIQYKQDKKSVDQSNLKDQINLMISNCERLKNSIHSAHTNTTGATTALQHWEAQLNTDLQALQTAIPPANGKTLNLSTLTEKQAYDQLQDQVSSLNSQISSLKTEINWLTVGEVSVGVVGGLVAVTNFWNPVGWVAAGLTAYGEVEMVGKKAADTATLNTDLENLALTLDEEAIIHPIYSIKNAVAQLSSGVNAIEGVSKSLESLKDNFSFADDDLESFLDDVTENATLDGLKGDVQYVLSDYQTLETICNTLLNPMPSKIVQQSALAKAQNAPSS